VKRWADRVCLATVKPGLRCCSSGAAVAEFALVFPFFLALTLGVIETGWLFTKFTLIDRAVANASRFVYTGAASTDATVTQASIEEFICDQAVIILSCEDNIALELIVIGSFDTPPPPDAPCRERDVTVTPVTNFDPGIQEEVVFMRVCITTNILMPFLGLGLALPKTPSGNFQYTSSTAFQNEPFGGAS